MAISCLILFFVFFSLHKLAVPQSDSKCSSDQRRFNEIIKSGKALDVFYFKNDTKKTIQLTWAGENSGFLILVTMTESDAGPGLTSDIYRSDNNGKTFIKITEELGEKVYIRREHGLQRQQNHRESKELFLICYDVEDKHHSLIFVTRNGGSTWDKSKVPFVLSGQLIFYPRQPFYRWILTLEEKTYRLFLSTDNGRSWASVHENVVDFFWSIYESDPEKTFYVLSNPGVAKNDTINQTLVKTTDLGRTWTHVMDHVVRVWAPRAIRTKVPTHPDQWETPNLRKSVMINSSMETTPLAADSNKEDRRSGRFLYVAHLTDLENQTMKLSVSTDGGKFFRPVYTPSIQSERFYSVLEVEDDLAFVHVDAPNDTGFGTLFTSDSSGQILTESLHHHLYPNHAPITDFYRIASMRGTYLTTRMNPNRTLYSVITHDRGASWRPLGVPLNVGGACKNDAPSMTTGKQPTSNPPTHSVRHSDEPTESMKSNSSKANSVDTAWDDFSASDLPSVRVCGLQISSHFSIRNRVIASAPLSISAAPGLILVHGHVATHLKNTPGDLFVSSDGGYTWNKALDGPHHCQIANRGALLVAVPADTLWPDALRFSTDEGRCWHTIPLRSGTFHVDQSLHVTPVSNVTVQETTVAPSDVPLFAHPGSTVTPDKFDNPATAAPYTSDSIIPTMRDETVVFAGLVTEPGGRAMAAAVYGYGTASQHWRVTVVDFITNGMVTHTCEPDDYETWTPHTASEKHQGGCLFGINQSFKRLKKDSLCINEYGMDPLLRSDVCICSPSDFECDYGYHRPLGSLDCIRDSKIPLLDPCLLPASDRNRTIFRGYRRIPGDRCQGGWHPPYLNESDARRILICSQDIQPLNETRSSRSSLGVSFVILTVTVLLILSLSAFCYQRNKRSIRSVIDSTLPNQHSVHADRIGYSVSPWKWVGRSGQARTQLITGNQESSWPPVSHSARWNFTQMDANGHSHDTLLHSGDPTSKERKPNSKLTSVQKTREYLQHRSHMRPAFIDRFRQNEPDVTGLIEAEEIAFPMDPPDEALAPEFEPVNFHDPLAHLPPKVTSNHDLV